MSRFTRLPRLGLAALALALALPAAAQDSFGQQPVQNQNPHSQQPAYPNQNPQNPYNQAPAQQPNTYSQQPAYPNQNPQDPYNRQPVQQPNPYSQQPAYPNQPGPNGPNLPQGADLDRLMQMERQDFGIAPSRQLHHGAMHGPTPTSIPGGQAITTKGLMPLLNDRSMGALVFDVLGGQETLPGAIAAVPAHQAGSFDDATQQQFGQFLQQMTQGRRDVPLVFYCASSQCWMSYNAALRAIALGYGNVLWYRGGIEAWKAAGLQTQPAGGYAPQQQTGNYQQPPQNGGYPQQW
ncbi:MAG: rhodanese-like domain-containing protein [Lysobacteraceae bacterium]